MKTDIKCFQLSMIELFKLFQKSKGTAQINVVFH